MARVLTLVSTLLLAVMFVTPVWSVRLVAPQYPEGIGMQIKLHTIEGAKKHDLENINTLNHYIGMKVIEPDAIPELRYMPWIVGGLVAAGLLVAALGRRRWLAGWLVTFALLGAAGMYDFWRWSYDYGHNLDLEKAVIVVPDMSYQPPLIGTKQLLNFTATSLPAAGGIAAGLAFVLAAAALVMSYRRSGRWQVMGAALAATACASNPHIAFGTDACAECRMIVSDSRFGAALQTKTGKVLPFDSTDCLLEYLRAHPDLEYQSAWVSDAASPSVLLRAEDAVYVRDGTLRPPMGSVVAFATLASARSINTPGSAAPVQTLSWVQLSHGSPGVAH